MIDGKDLMHEMMIDVFIDLQDDDFDKKSTKEILLAWVQWIDARYKVAVIPDICYAIIDCEHGDVVSMINADMPNAKQQANQMCASLNNVPPLTEELSNDKKDDMLHAKDVADAFLDMDDDSFMDFLLGHISQEKEE